MVFRPDLRLGPWIQYPIRNRVRIDLFPRLVATQPTMSIRSDLYTKHGSSNQPSSRNPVDRERCLSGPISFLNKNPHVSSVCRQNLGRQICKIHLSIFLRNFTSFPSSRKGHSLQPYQIGNHGQTAREPQ